MLLNFNVNAGVFFIHILVFSSRFLLNNISQFLQWMIYFFCVLLAAWWFDLQSGQILDHFFVQFKRKYMCQKQNISFSIFSAIGITEDRRFVQDQLLTLVLHNCKQPFVGLDFQMKPEDANKDPDCTARSAQGCHRVHHIGLRLGNNEALQAALKKSSCNKDALYSFLKKNAGVIPVDQK